MTRITPLFEPLKSIFDKTYLNLQETEGQRDGVIAEGVVISTPSATHLVGLPHQGSPYRSRTRPHLPRSFET
jgi:hypothetical protein